MHGIDPFFCVAKPDDGFEPDLADVSEKAAGAELVFICNPNNPTGVLFSSSFITTLLKEHPRVCFVVDESYLPFVDESDTRSLIRAGTRYPNLMVLSSMSKIFAIPGLRTGFLSGSADLIEKVRRYSQPWNVNALAQAVINDIYGHPEQIAPFYEKPGYLSPGKTMVSETNRKYSRAEAGSRLYRIYPVPAAASYRTPGVPTGGAGPDFDP